MITAQTERGFGKSGAHRLAGGVRTYLLSLVVLVIAALPVLGEPIAWVAPSLTRVRPLEAPSATTHINLFAAKGETESFQIIVRAPAGGLSNVNILVPELGGLEPTLYREYYLYISPGTTDWYTNRNRPEADGYFPDGLIPFLDPNTGEPPVGGELQAVPFDLAEGTNQPIWVDLRVPQTFTAGDYTSEFTVTSDQGNVTVSVTLQVWEFAIPLQPAMKSAFLVYEDDIRDTANVELLKHRVMPTKVRRENERGFINTLGLNFTNIGFYSFADASTGFMLPPPTVEEIRERMANHEPDLPLYNYTADEIYITGSTTLFEPLKEWGRNLHEAGCDNLVCCPPVAALRDDGSGTGRSAVDIWVLLPKIYDVFYYDVLAALAKGDQAWSYNCLVQDDYSPKWMIDYAPINFRIQPGFINQSLDLTGLLYWTVDSWTPDPWNCPYGYMNNCHYPGDGVLIYPGDKVGLNGVAPSMRLKYIRDGVDDYDYIQLLKECGEGDWALSLARTIGPNWDTWSRDPVALEAVRLQLGTELDRLAHPIPTVAVTASADPDTVPSAGSASLSASATDSEGYGIASWEWSDGGAGGVFLPSAAVSHPTYQAATNMTGRDREVTLTVSATCTGGPIPVTESADEILTVLPGQFFSDVPPGFWAYSEIQLCAAGCIVAGYPDGTYQPLLTVTRDQMAVYIARALAGGDANVPAFADTPTFPDVGAEHWALRYVEYAVDAGVVAGYGDGNYYPGLPVDRGQMAVFVARALAGGEAGVPTPSGGPTFPDVPADFWAYRHVEYCAANGVVNGYGDGNYYPANPVTRDQMAVYVKRAFGL